MHTLKYFQFAVSALVLCAASAFAAEVETINLTPSGSDTNFTIAGTFGPDAPLTSYSAPNTPYQLLFSVPTTPTMFLVLDDANQLFVLGTSATLNGVGFPDSSLVAYTEASGGGIGVCVGIVCNPEGIIGNVTFDIYGQQLYTGSYNNPTFIEGNAHIDQTSGSDVTAIYFPTPEPASTGLAAMGVISLILLVRCKYDSFARR